MKYKKSSETEGVDPKPAGFVLVINTAHFLTLLGLFLPCFPMGCSPPGSSVHGILQARILENTFSSPGGLPDPGIKPVPPALQADSLQPEPPGKPLHFTWCQFKIQFK